MNILIGCITLAVIYLIFNQAYKMWNNSSTYDKMDEIENTEELATKIIDFNKNHKNSNKNKETVKKFKKH